MDKNLIRIDDLVRQHLEGAEEKERGGAWLKMRDLLDQEMPQKKRIGILYWRRMFGLVAAVSLIGTLAVGSYEFSSAYKRLQTAEVVSPISNAKSTESGQIAMELPAGEPENEPATSGNISVRANTHAARTAPVTATASNNNADNNTVNNTTNNTLTTENTNTYQGNNHNSNAKNNVADVNIHGSRVLYTTTTGTGVIDNNTNNNATNNTDKTNDRTEHNVNAIAAINSKAVPDKPVTGDDKGGVRNGKRNNANKNTTACAVNKTPSTGGKNGKTVTAACDKNAKVAGNDAANAVIPGAAANAAAANNNVNTASATSAENAVAKNEPTAAMNHSTGKQNIGALNSSGPSITTSKAGVQTASAKELPKVGNAASTGTAANNGATKTNGAANNYSGNIKASRIKKATANNGAVAANNKANAGKANSNTGANAGNATAAKTNSSSSATDKNTVATNGKAASNNSTANLSGNVSAKRINKGSEKAVARNSSKATASKTAPAKTEVAANTGAATMEEYEEIEEPVTTATTATTANKGAAKTATTKETATAAKNNTTVKADKTTAQEQKTASNSKEAGNAKATSNGKISGKPVSTNAMALNSGGNNETDKPDEHKTITKMVVREREVKNSDNEVMTAVDTLSMEKMNRGNAKKEQEEEEPATAGAAPANKNTANTGIAAQETGNNEPLSGSVRAKRKHRHSEENTALAAEENAGGETETAPAVAAAPATEETAAASAPAAPAEAKTKEKSKHSGASLLKRMSAMFNDVKDHARGARPIAGITAGINSNYFGPSKMMGFQFGMTGTMEFSETWSLMGELKYFHRINSNTINDDYYEYTQMGNQYQKQLVQTSYDFAAAHNIEMPMTIRYAKGNFNFYTGPNFLYSFSINTARARMPVTTDPTMVSTQGTDNAPKFSDADFGSRFGLGYIFGFSYQVAPNTSLDLRNVQTVLDNASTTGAKSVSSMLYKTPSVQLSIMYRLGGNKNKD